jgi:LPS O-antigen subunit length determinant protein (WzzB/FepE family)
VDLYVAAINKHMQHRKMTTINNSVEYLQREIEKSSIAGMHQVLYTIIEEQIKSKMISEASPEHTFVLVSPSMTPEEPSEPQRLLLLTLGTFFGFLLSVIVVLIGDVQRGSRNKSFM